MNGIFFAIVIIAFLVAAYRQMTWVPSTADDASPMDQLAIGMIDTASSSVTLAIGLIGVMALFLGLMKVAEEGGLLVIIATMGARTVQSVKINVFFLWGYFKCYSET